MKESSAALVKSSIKVAANIEIIALPYVNDHKL